MDEQDRIDLSLDAEEVNETLAFLQQLECLHSESVSANDQLVAPGERPCPICNQPMASQGREGVTLDTCPRHGVWLDSGELEAILDRLRRGAKINREHAYNLGYKKGYADGRARASY